MKNPRPLSAASESQKNIFVKNIIKVANSSQLPKNVRIVSQFIEKYFNNVTFGDVSQSSPEELFGLVHAHWKFASKREHRKALVRTYNPTLKKDGWNCKHTVIEITNEDMPFLLDSITLELNRLGLNPHLTLHPVVNVLRSKAGKMEGIYPISNMSHIAVCESFIHMQISKQPDQQLAKIKA